MSFWGALFRPSDIIESGVKAVDSAFFTDQERAAVLVEFAKATTPMAMARRVIAFAVTALWVLGVLICGALLFVESDKYGVMAGFMAETINTPFSIIMGFYFLAHVVQRGKNG